MDAMFAPEDRRELSPREAQPTQVVGPFSRELVSVGNIPSELLTQRIIFMPPHIDEATAHNIVGQLLYLESQDVDEDIQLYIDCHGSTTNGHLYEGLAIYDTMQTVQPDVSTVCIGSAKGIAAAILAGGAKGKRFCLPHGNVILHEPYSKTGGQASEIDIMVRELLRQRSVFYEILSQHSGQSIERIEQDASRVNYMTAQQALEYGLIDEILPPAGRKVG